MPEYFDGVKITGPVSLPGKRRNLTCQVSEQWRSLDQDLVALCGAPVEQEIIYTQGFSQRDYDSLENTLGATLGSKDVAQISVTLKQAIGTEVTWKLEKIHTQKVKAEAPECGSQRCEVLQLHRTYLWTHDRSFLRFLGTVECQHAEPTLNTAVIYYTDEIDSKCRCKPKQERRLSGLIDVFIKNLQLILPGYEENGAAIASVGNITVQAAASGDAKKKVLTSELPAWIVGLAGLDADEEAEMIVRLHHRARFDLPPPMSIENEVDVVGAPVAPA